MVDKISMSPECFDTFRNYIFEQTGVVLDGDRRQMLEGRLRKRLRFLSLDSYDSYFELIQTESGEHQTFIDLVTTHKTLFYRTPRVWEYLLTEYLPKWKSENLNKVFRIWSSASSSGEEVYTIAMMCEEFKRLNSSFEYQILGSDISQAMVELCQEGHYESSALETLEVERPDWLHKYLNVQTDGTLRVNSRLKENVTFVQHNLFHELRSTNEFDVVFVRNVLIYFDVEGKQRVLNLISEKMASPSLLVIGESESLRHIDASFQLVAPFLYRTNDVVVPDSVPGGL